MGEDIGHYEFSLSKPIRSDKYLAIRQAIENSINGIQERLYTEREVLEKEEIVFNAAQEILNGHLITKRYNSYSQYKNSLQK